MRSLPTQPNPNSAAQHPTQKRKMPNPTHTCNERYVSLIGYNPFFCSPDLPRKYRQELLVQELHRCFLEMTARTPRTDVIYQVYFQNFSPTLEFLQGLSDNMDHMVKTGIMHQTEVEKILKDEAMECIKQTLRDHGRNEEAEGLPNFRE